MDVSNFEIDAQLLEQFSSLGTDDKDDLVNAFKCVVGGVVTSECSRFFLELANWNLQKGIGAYFDYSFESAPGGNTNSTIPNATVEFGNQTLLPQEAIYDARVYLYPTEIRQTPSLVWYIQNSGSTTWPQESYATLECDTNVAKHVSCDNSVIIWSPLSSETRIPLPELPPGNLTHLLVDLQPPTEEFCMRSLSSNTPIVGALRLCLPNGSRFGEVLYCTAIPDIASRSIVFKTGHPYISSTEPVVDTVSEMQPMEDL